jgi:Asp-tRNA(Asn)/Glu-tRNA(Gln) amidotransferase A subunit family amidase
MRPSGTPVGWEQYCYDRPAEEDPWMDATDLCYTPAVTLARAIRARELSPVELIDVVLARIEVVNPRINAYCTVAAERAVDAAKAAESQMARGEPIGPLHGLPVSFKDLTPTAGIRTTMGSKIFEHHVPTADALVVERAKAAGAVVVGKTNTPEFGCKGVTDNRVFGPTRNPWNLGMTAGGSSGGAGAALAAGLGPLAEGSDRAGSIRIPAAACGVVGLKPGPGRVPRHPAPNGWQTLSVHGPMARTVRDAALLFGVLCGPDERDPSSLPDTGEDFLAACDGPLGRLRVAWSPDLGYAPVDPRVATVAGAAARIFADLGCELEETSPGFADPDEVFRALAAPGIAAGLAQYFERWGEQMDPILTGLARQAERISAVDYERMLGRRTELWHTVRRFFERYDLLLTPTLAVPPLPIDDPYPPREVAGRPSDSPLGWFPFTFPFNLTGHPAISVPAGWTVDGLPIGLQIVGRRFGEAGLLRAAAAFEAARPWAHQRPPLGAEP